MNYLDCSKINAIDKYFFPINSNGHKYVWKGFSRLECCLFSLSWFEIAHLGTDSKLALLRYRS